MLPERILFGKGWIIGNTYTTDKFVFTNKEGLNKRNIEINPQINEVNEFGSLTKTEISSET
jgi:hypothetical protein